jgi:hypothetical protein
MCRHFDVMGNLLFAQWNLGMNLISKQGLGSCTVVGGAVFDQFGLVDGSF